MIKRASFTLTLLCTFAASAFAVEPAPTPDKPNILFILADDLGYGDLGVTFQNARKAQGKPAFSTPNLDALASNGILLRQHYTGSPVCAPARGSLMTGQSQGDCPIRDNEFDKPLPDHLLTLGSMLKLAGYHTVAVGKWGLGGHARSGFPAHPSKRGFDNFFGFMLHGTGHVYYHDAEHPLMDETTDVGAKYENVYSTDLFTARAKQFITDHHAQHPNQPFFMYLAYTAVHNALDIPGEPYPAGGGLHGGLHWPLAPTPKTRNTWLYPEFASQPWTDNMKRYATMARRMDDGVGDILQLLKDLHLADNTLIVFTSDNGPANENGSDPRLFSSWGPFDGFKRDVFEGGVREPTIASWPGHIPTGVTSDTVTAFWDWMPTLAQFAHLPAPAQSEGLSIAPLLLGSKDQRQHPYLYIEYNFPEKKPHGTAIDVAARKGPIREQQQFVRIGDFVGLRTHINSPSDPLRLYNVATDPHEDHNLASDPSHAPLLKQMTDLLVTARHSDLDAPRPYDNVPLPAVTPAAPTTPGQVKTSLFPGSFPYTPDTTALTPTSTSPIDGFHLPPNLPTGPYALEFQTYFNAPTTGTYTFTATTDAGLHLWIHDDHLIEHDPHTTAPLTASVHLSAGLHPLRLTYLHQSGQPQLSLQYSGPDITERPIPSSSLQSAN